MYDCMTRLQGGTEQLFREKGELIMSMIGKIGEDSRNILQMENIYQKIQKSAGGAENIFQRLQQPNGEKDDDTVIGKAAEVQISAAGRKLSEEALDPLRKMGQTDFMTEGEKNLQELNDKIAAREDYKKQAEKLQERIDTDTSLTAEEKARMQEEADELKEKGMSPDDKLHELYGKKQALREKMEAGSPELTEAEQAVAQLQMQREMAEIERGITEADNQIANEGALKELYTQEIIQERGDITLAKSRAKDLNVTLDMRSSELSMAIRTEEQVAEQGERNVTRDPRPEDVVQEAIEEGKERTEVSSSPAPDKGMAAAMDVQQDMQATNGTIKHVSQAEEQLQQTEQLEAMTIEDLLER